MKIKLTKKNIIRLWKQCKPGTAKKLFYGLLLIGVCTGISLNELSKE